jgi:hypothetical protein
VFCMCCRKCFTSNSNPKIKERDEYHLPPKCGQKVDKRLGRIGNYANHQSSVHGATLPPRSIGFRKKNVQKTCWELWHTVPDFMNGPSETLCHVTNQQEELGVVAETTTIRPGPLSKTQTRKKK